MSGVVSILFAGITIKHYTHNNITPEAQDMYASWAWGSLRFECMH